MELFDEVLSVRSYRSSLQGKNQSLDQWRKQPKTLDTLKHHSKPKQKYGKMGEVSQLLNLSLNY